MKLIKPKVESVYCTELDGILNVIQAAAKICYASQKFSDKPIEICRFIDQLINLGHYSPLGHGIFWVNTIMVSTRINDPVNWFLKSIIDDREQSRHFWVSNESPRIIGISARTIAQNFDQQGREFANFTNFYNVIKDKFYDYFLNIKRIPFELRPFSFEIWSNSKALKQLNRHNEEMALCEQSTRYCNFHTDRFGNEVQYLQPYWWEDEKTSQAKKDFYISACQRNENDYLQATSKDKNGNAVFSTDEASTLLSSDVLSKGIYTASVREWKHIIEVRVKGTTGKPHGDIKEAITLLMNKYEW